MTMKWSPDYLGSPGKMVLAKDYPADDDARAYVAAVESADELDTPGIGALEPAVVAAYDNFIVGCKSDGIWDAIKASCILAGARTLSGALVPLAGTAPTNNGPFVAADYDRKTGLVGDGSTKYLNANRTDNADPQDNSHRSVYVSTAGTSFYSAYIGIVYTNPTRQSYIMRAEDLGGRMIITERGGTAGGQTDASGQQNATGFIGQARSTSSEHLGRVSGFDYTLTSQSQATLSASSFVFARNFNGSANTRSNARLAFYSIGEALPDLSPTQTGLELLDNRVSTLISDLGAAIP